jgi:hypothetical protein
MAVSALTDEQTRQVRDYLPSLSNRPFGFDLAAKLAAIITDLNAAQPAAAVVSGTDDIISGADNVIVALDASHDGSTVVATLQEADGVITVANAVWDGSGNLTITLSAVTTDIRTVGYFYVVGQ